MSRLSTGEKPELFSFRVREIVDQNGSLALVFPSDHTRSTRVAIKNVGVDSQRVGRSAQHIKCSHGQHIQDEIAGSSYQQNSIVDDPVDVAGLERRDLHNQIMGQRSTF